MTLESRTSSDYTGSMVGIRVMVSLGLMACAPPASLPTAAAYDPFARYPAAGSRRFGAPVATSEAWPWKIGQWVRYKRQHPGGAALEELTLAAQDTCGYWLVYASHENGASMSWTFCVSTVPSWDGPQLKPMVVVERRNREVIRVDDLRVSPVNAGRYAWLAALVHTPSPGRTDVPREDVGTPAGQFLGAAKDSTTEGGVQATRWSHPAVPLGGIVKEVASDHERVVLAFGFASNGNAIELAMWDLELAHRSFREVNEPGSFWWGMGGGLDALGSVSDVDATFGFTGGGGIRVARAIDAVVKVRVSGAASSVKDPALHEDMFLAGAGVRWYPLGRTRVSPTRRWLETARLYTEADLGYAELERWAMDGEQDTVGRGAAVGATVGVVVMQGRDWATGLEAHDHLAAFNADEGLRNVFGVNWFIQLYLGPSRYSLPW